MADVDGKKVGIVTSGTQSPQLNNGIGLGYVEIPFHKPNQQISILIREKLVSACIINPPFIKDTSLHQ